MGTAVSVVTSLCVRDCHLSLWITVTVHRQPDLYHHAGPSPG